MAIPWTYFPEIFVVFVWQGGFDTKSLPFNMCFWSGRWAGILLDIGSLDAYFETMCSCVCGNSVDMHSLAFSGANVVAYGFCLYNFLDIRSSVLLAIWSDIYCGDRFGVHSNRLGRTCNVAFCLANVMAYHAQYHPMYAPTLLRKPAFAEGASWVVYCERSE